MKILSIETSGRWSGYSLVEGDKVQEEVIFLSRNLSSFFLSYLEKSLRRLKMGVKDLDLIAVSTGPGSFTGLRVGLSIGKAFSLSHHIPLVGIPTPRVVREGVSFSSLPIMVLLGCRRDAVYVFLYKKEGSQWNEVISGEVVEINNLGKTVGGQKVLVCGEGFLLYEDKIREILKDSGEFLPSPNNFSRPSQLAFLAREIGEKSKWEEGLSLSPLYMSFPRIGDRNGPIQRIT
ncbi:MAG: tRNA (adenosine(37)-N6)-threonylcarbamoyltransferase complex dimerization subunit type 1 TsaB [Caldiserica bacterium]|nr:tRNA (adenosine(37)-N6)-threonylcarbamoyltransferase complex dimerization subunit type 1 TsaB [Caldisericota bacterium]